MEGFYSPFFFLYLFYLLFYSQVLDEIEENGIHIYPLPDCDTDEEEDYKEQVGTLLVC